MDFDNFKNNSHPYFSVCPFDGNWGGWSSWSSECDCALIYTKTRTRQCNNPAPSCGGAFCSGSSTNTYLCSCGKL